MISFWNIPNSVNNLDEIDSSTTRLVSVNRYKRNFDFIDQILSPYNLADITPPSIFPDASSQKVDDLNAKLVKKKKGGGRSPPIIEQRLNACFFTILVGTQSSRN